jgi:DNA-binding transcriptional MerR regulator/methylmalonyl-CoA mutase cobalamin-binding subunit
MFTIKHAAALTGVPEATLRAWERRYAVVSPHRTEAGYRLYDEDQLAVLRTMQDLVSRGWSPREAAKQLEQGTAAAPDSSVDTTAARAPVDAGPAAVVEEPDGLTDPALAAAAAALDLDQVGVALDAAFARGSFESVVTSWLFPSLRALGDGWESGEVSIAGEHLVSAAVLRRLAAAYDAAGRRPGAPRAVVGLPPAARHELGLLAFATAARRAGIEVVYLGADLPQADWARAVTEHGARAAVIAVPCEADLPAARAVARHLHRGRPDLLVAVGGGRQDGMPSFCVRLGHHLGAAAEDLRRLIEL